LREFLALEERVRTGKVADNAPFAHTRAWLDYYAECRRLMRPVVEELLARRNARPWARQWRAWECRLMNLLDARYWFCPCRYEPPYGKVIYGDCRRHM
jgi:hypothetical protein